VAAKPAAVGLAQAAWNLLVPLREGGMGFLLLAALGAPALAVRRPRPALALTAGAVATALAVAAIANPIHRRTGELVLWFTAPFLLPVLAAAAAAFGAAAAGTGRWRPAVRSLMGATILFNIAAGLTDRDHRRDFLGHDFGRNMLA